MENFEYTVFLVGLEPKNPSPGQDPPVYRLGYSNDILGDWAIVFAQQNGVLGPAGIERTVAHEMGHLFGLRHTDELEQLRITRQFLKDTPYEIFLDTFANILVHGDDNLMAQGSSAASEFLSYFQWYIVNMNND